MWLADKLRYLAESVEDNNPPLNSDQMADLLKEYAEEANRLEWEHTVLASKVKRLERKLEERQLELPLEA